MMSFWAFGRRSTSKKEMIDRLKAQNQLLQTSEDTYKQKIINLEDENKQLTQDIQRLDILNKELSEKVNKEEPYDKIYNERLELKKQERVKDSRIDELEGERKELCETVENLKAEAKNLVEKSIKLKADLEEEKSKLENVCKEKQAVEIRCDESVKEKEEYENEITQLKEEFEKIRMEKETWDKTKQQSEEKVFEDKSVSTDPIAYIEEARQEIAEYKTRAEDLQLASEALKSENESLFRANESKAREINEIKKELTEIKQELMREQVKYAKLQQEWEEDRRGTEFVLVSKSARSKTRSRVGTLETTKEENDSEDEHILSLVESTKAESEALREKEKAYKKRISELQTDKAELFRSGSNLFLENKSLKSRYDNVLGERERLLKSESALKRKVREQDKEIADLKKTVDDMYYQNIAIKANDDNESKRNAYVVVMGNEMIKTLEREKSALYRRVKYLEKENNEIETRVTELQKQSDTLIKYTQKFDRQSNISASRQGSRIDMDTDKLGRRRYYEYGQTTSQKAIPFFDFEPGPKTPTQRLLSQDRDRKPPSGRDRKMFQDIYDDSKATHFRNYSRDRDKTSQMSRPLVDRYDDNQPVPQSTDSRDPFRDDQQPSPSRGAFRDPFKEAFDPFRPRPPRHAPNVETLDSNTGKNKDSYISLPRIDGIVSPRPRSRSSTGPNSRRVSPVMGRK